MNSLLMRLESFTGLDQDIPSTMKHKRESARPRVIDYEKRSRNCVPNAQRKKAWGINFAVALIATIIYIIRDKDYKPIIRSSYKDASR